MEELEVRKVWVRDYQGPASHLSDSPPATCARSGSLYVCYLLTYPNVILKSAFFSFDRIADGKEPTCVTACPSEAVTFGDAGHIQSLANRRLAELLTAGYADVNISPGGLMGGGGGGGGAGTHVIWVLIDKPSE